MENVIAEIPLNSDLFRQAETVAKEMNISQSHLFVLALEEFLGRRKERLLLERINDAYEAFPDPDEKRTLDAMRLHQRHLVEDEW